MVDLARPSSALSAHSGVESRRFPRTPPSKASGRRSMLKPSGRSSSNEVRSWNRPFAARKILCLKGSCFEPAVYRFERWFAALERARIAEGALASSKLSTEELPPIGTVHVSPSAFAVALADFLTDILMVWHSCESSVQLTAPTFLFSSPSQTASTLVHTPRISPAGRTSPLSRASLSMRVRPLSIPRLTTTPSAPPNRPFTPSSWAASLAQISR